MKRIWRSTKKAPPRRGYGDSERGRVKDQNHGSHLVCNILMNCRHEELRVPFERFGQWASKIHEMTLSIYQRAITLKLTGIPPETIQRMIPELNEDEESVVTEKVGIYILNMATFSSGFAIVLINCWQTAFIILVTSLFIVGAGGISNIFLHKLAENIHDAYVKAASVCYS
ncbi:ABC transporter B family member 20-like protein [Tanacetum coccineum]